jgi:protein-tyrosine phosphatase
MGEDCVNFRDIGVWVNLLAAQPLLPAGRLLRGGTLDRVGDAAAIGAPGTIINLRRRADRHAFGATLYHVPVATDTDVYATVQRDVRRWLNTVLQVFVADSVRYPVLIHCASGKDRTGVVTAAVLRILEIPEAVVVDEYLLSDGMVNAAWIRQALAGMGDPGRYFRRVELQRVRASIFGATGRSSGVGVPRRALG